MSSVAELISHAARMLEEAGVENPDLEATALMAAAIGTGRSGVIARLRETIGPAQARGYRDMVRRRVSREPRQYILGREDFFGLGIKVGRAVLIPRPETELLVEEGIKALEGAGGALAADIGTGSGCIAVALAVNLPDATVYAVDSSGAALEVAAGNAGAHGVSGRVLLLEGGLFEPLRTLGLAGKLDLIVTNPPYIPSGDIPGLQPEVQYEPLQALDGGEGGLDVIKEILHDAPEYLRPGGRLLMEVGYDQAFAVQGLLDFDLNFEKFVVDFAGIKRVLVAVKS